MSQLIAPKTIIFSGGGTGGSVTPLLSVAHSLWKSHQPGTWRYVFVGAKNGPERELVAEFVRHVAPLEFVELTAGKWRRYFSGKNFLDIFRVGVAYLKSFKILRRFKPDLIISAGGFVSVPLVWAAAGRHIPIIIHQQDARPGLANKLMAPFARVVTVTFEKSLLDYGPKAVWIGNPMEDISNKDQADRLADIRNKYNLKPDKPLLLVIGGALGAQAINQLIWKAQSDLSSFCQTLHQTGVNKNIIKTSELPAYQSVERLPHQDLLDLMAVADVVISRCGLASLTELAAYRKAAILIPIPHSHQEDNAAVFATAKAALVLNQTTLNSEMLVNQVKDLLSNFQLKKSLENNITKVIKRDALDKFQDIIAEILA